MGMRRAEELFGIDLFKGAWNQNCLTTDLSLMALNWKGKTLTKREEDRAYHRERWSRDAFID
jgi:hypothetical protein